MKLMEFCDGIQHIGIPTDRYDETICFYEKIGFDITYETVNEGNKVGFLKFETLVLEVYESADVSPRDGAVDHFAVNCNNIDAAYENAVKEGYEIMEPGIRKLPFWANGIRFFIIAGPNKEKIELCQIL